MEAVCFSETFVGLSTYMTTRRFNSEDQNWHVYHRVNSKSEAEFEFVLSLHLCVKRGMALLN
jgi:hypothetical protein